MPRLAAVLLAVGLSLGAVLGISGCAGGSVTPLAATTPAALTYTVVASAVKSGFRKVRGCLTKDPFSRLAWCYGTMLVIQFIWTLVILSV
jgi:hypothetical protein